MYDAFGLYDYYLDMQVAEEMGFDTLEELYTEMQNEYERNRAIKLAGADNPAVRNTRNAR